MANTFRFINGRFILEDKTMAFVTFANGKYRGHDSEFRESGCKGVPIGACLLFP
jgi:hypothetical protein